MGKALHHAQTNFLKYLLLLIIEKSSSCIINFASLKGISQYLKIVGKSVWPVLGPPPQHFREHGTLFLLHLSAILSKIENKESPPVTFVETPIKEMIFLYKAQEKPM